MTQVALFSRLVVWLGRQDEVVQASVLGLVSEEALTLPGPVEALTLELSGLIDATSRQELLPGFHSRRPWQLAEASRQLKQRFGTSGLYRVAEVEPWSRLPERRQALIAYEP